MSFTINAKSCSSKIEFLNYDNFELIVDSFSEKAFTLARIFSFHSYVASVFSPQFLIFGFIKFDPNVKQNQHQQQTWKHRGRRKECFPQNHILHKICYKNTLKISYRTMPNISSHISKQNSKILRENLNQNLQQSLSNKELDERGHLYCNFRNKAECLMPAQCQLSNMVYNCFVKRLDTNTTESYTGCTVGFKTRHLTHMAQVVNRKISWPFVTPESQKYLELCPFSIFLWCLTIFPLKGCHFSRLFKKILLDLEIILTFLWFNAWQGCLADHHLCIEKDKD